ncbi:MAG: family 16 glycosylhydrolase, partial [Propionicimonas sp.]
MPKPSWKLLVPAAVLVLSSSLLISPVPADAVVSAGTTTTVTTWQQRLHAKYQAYRRHCSAPKAANSIVSGPQVTLLIAKQTDPGEIAAAAAAGCDGSLISQGRVYSNAMVSTEDQPAGMMTAGTTTPTVVETRIKFPSAKGMHGGVWIQSEGNRGPEIDLVESYGTRVTHVHHVTGASDQRGYKSLKKSATWYKKEHTFRVEFTTAKIVYSIDGKVTNTVTNANLPADMRY